MKRAFSIVLVTLLIISTSLLLVACGISGESDWDDAIEEFKTADVITLKIHDRNVNLNNLLDKPRVVTDAEISFDANKGLVRINIKTTASAVVDLDPTKTDHTLYYVLDGSNIICYDKNNNLKYSEPWDDPETLNFDSVEEAKTYLRNLYLRSTDKYEEEFPNFIELGYEGHGSIAAGHNTSSTENLFKTKFTLQFSDDVYSYTYTLKFSLAGKVSKFTYEHKSSQNQIDDTRKFTMTIKYSANITLPDDLPTAN